MEMTMNGFSHGIDWGAFERKWDAITDMRKFIGSNGSGEIVFERGQPILLVRLPVSITFPPARCRSRYTIGEYLDALTTDYSAFPSDVAMAAE